MENSKEPEKKKIKEEDLGTVSGGCGKKIDPHEDKRYWTYMVCSNCDYNIYWLGNFLDGKDYRCTHCGKISLRGKSIRRNPSPIQ